MSFAGISSWPGTVELASSGSLWVSIESVITSSSVIGVDKTLGDGSIETHVCEDRLL